MSLLCYIVLCHFTRPRPVPFYPTPGVPSVWGVWRSLPPADPALSCPDTSYSRVDVCGCAGREATVSPCASEGAGGMRSHLRRRSHVAGEGVERFGNDVTDVTPSRRATAALRLPPPVPCWRRGPQRGGSGGSGSPSGARPDPARMASSAARGPRCRERSRRGRSGVGSVTTGRSRSRSRAREGELRTYRGRAVPRGRARRCGRDYGGAGQGVAPRGTASCPGGITRSSGLREAGGERGRGWRCRLLSCHCSEPPALLASAWS